jgi:hypothetical protein
MLLYSEIVLRVKQLTLSVLFARKRNFIKNGILLLLLLLLMVVVVVVVEVARDGDRLLFTLRMLV